MKRQPANDPGPVLLTVAEVKFLANLRPSTAAPTLSRADGIFGSHGISPRAGRGRTLNLP
jgi:hypothetical protein